MRTALAVLAVAWASASAAAVLDVPPGAPRLSGRVVDAATGEAVAGARVLGEGGGVVSDVEGRFALSVAPGTRLRVEAEGFAARNAVAAPGMTVSLTRVALSQEVVVTASLDETTGPRPLDLGPQRVLAAPGSATNVFRLLRTLPGVAPAGEVGSRISVRGGAPDQNLTLLDGVEIHNPYRLFGLVSAFHPDTIERFDLSVGGFGAARGDRLSSVLAVETRDGTRDRPLAGTATLGLTDVSVLLEGRLPDSATGSWLVATRRTYYDLVAERFTDGDLPAFRDVQLKLAWEPRPGTRVALLGLTSREGADAVFDGDTPRERADLEAGISHDLLAATFQATIGKAGFARTIVSGYRNRERLDVLASFVSGSRRANAPDDEAVTVSSVDFDRFVGVEDLAVRQEIGLQLADGHRLGAGVEAHRVETGVRFATRGDRNLSAANGSSVRGGVGLPDALDASVSRWRGGAWVEHAFEPWSGVELESGLRLDLGFGETLVSPRVRATWAADPGTRISAAVGAYAQSVGWEKLAQSDYFLDLAGAEARRLGAERAVHVIGGVERDFGAAATLRIEGYYKRFTNLAIGRLETEAARLARVSRFDFPEALAGEVPSEARITGSPAGDGRGHAYGVDVLLERRAAASGRVSGWLAYSWGVAARQAYGRTYPFEYDRRHSVSLALAFRPTPRWELSAVGRLATGFPRTPVSRVRVSDVADSGDTDGDGDLAERVPERDGVGRLVWVADYGGVDRLHAGRLPAFARVDLRAAFRPGGRQGRWEIYLDVVNALGRSNPERLDATLEHDPASDRPRVLESPEGSIPLLPSLGVRFRF